MSFETALSGLNAAASDLDVTGNNIANSGTVGFKSSRAEFADLFAASNLGVSQTAIGQGVRLADVKQSFGQGQFDFTGNSLDLAINGTGFFRISEGEGEVSYTRNGSFQLDRDGYIVDANNRRLTGYQADGDGNIGGALDDLQVNIGNVAPEATTELSVSANLDAAAAEPANAFDATDPQSYNFSTSTTIYDGQGTDHRATLYFRKTATANEWEVHVDGGGTGGVLGPRTLSFNNDGTFDSLSDTSAYTFNYPGVDPVSVTPDFDALTQFGAEFEVKQINQDGFAAGQFSSLNVEGDGRLLARFTNGQSQVLGQVALARFQSPEKLQEAGDTRWRETFESGPALLGAPDSSGLGSLEAGALEQSNVNLTEQLVQMITAQRNYQANSQVISTQDQITQEILNIR
ncbi:flagellar hook protein FlgE [Sediminicurvatus halobius]|uniref:Flagellar hook protein FlgE n=1 Tax=Sediminicurvatus halobius TaxID=2182432 RepID=A0A2U2MZA4_9GAMM|nr:flagellar hook protein FlgE [Spiribacter halobius]PWG62311.1 flagellar hook protein FlgE [Spiribacter halobius]UEX79768.1 flagellar hook protein FlgE [Spiribacter halobius]